MHPSSEQPEQSGHSGHPGQSPHAGQVDAGQVDAADNTDQVGPADGTGLLAGLDRLPDRPLHEHAAVYEQVHSRLQAALSEIDSA